MLMSDDIFDQSSLFQGLTASQRALLRPLFVPIDFYPEAIIFEQSDPADYLYVVIGGEVVVNFKPYDGPALTVARVKPGDIVGWSAALGRHTYTSSASCVTYTQLLRVRGEDLRMLCELHPDTGIVILERLASVIAERLHSTHEIVVQLLEIGLRRNA
jgi:CRP/FNR family transcriptional regulator, cyclic AMP receptor protein